MDVFASDMSADFRPFGVTAVSIWLGAVLTERLQQIIDHGPELAYLHDIAETPHVEPLNYQGSAPASCRP